MDNRWTNLGVGRLEYHGREINNRSGHWTEDIGDAHPKP